MALHGGELLCWVLMPDSFKLVKLAGERAGISVILGFIVRPVKKGETVF